MPLKDWIMLRMGFSRIRGVPLPHSDAEGDEGIFSCPCLELSCSRQ